MKEKYEFICSKCDKKAVFERKGQRLCKDHFLNNVESKVFKCINKYKLFSKEDTVCIAASGGKDSLTALYMTMLYCRKHNIKFFALCIDEGIADYRDHSLADLKIFCETYKIPLEVLSFKERYGLTLDEMITKARTEYNKKPCSVCGIFRRSLLNEGAKKFGATKLVTGHNLDDEVQSVLMNQFLGNAQHNASLGPITGLSNNKGFVSRVKPLYFVSEQETRLFCFLKKFQVRFHECPNIHLSFRSHVRDKVNEIEQLIPGAKNGVINSFLETLPLLKQHFKTADTKKNNNFQLCVRCGQPASGEVCNACLLEEQLCADKK